MSKLMAHILVGVLVAAVLMFIKNMLLPESLRASEAFDTFISLCYVACIVVPCAIYFAKNKPGTNNKGDRVE